MLSTLLLALGVCNDRSPHCYPWSLDGQCETNTAFMHKTCPLSCRICEHNCTDTSTDCSFWAKSGECENNTAFMLKTCPTACGLCTPKCIDTHGGFETGPSANETMCDKWARQGDCQGNPDFVLKHCPVACGVCKPKCKDLHEGCPAWLAAGECNNNTQFMLKHCPASCGVCKDEHQVTEAPADSADDAPAVEGADSSWGCHDKPDKAVECKTWVQAGECHSNPAFMLKNCAESCGLCTHVCSDHDPSCPAWSQRNGGTECDENKGFMLATCPASCGVCSELAKLPVRKDEL